MKSKIDRLLTPLEAAEYLGLDSKSFEELVKKFRIPHYRIGGKFIRFSQQELEKYRREAEKSRSEDKKEFLSSKKTILKKELATFSRKETSLQEPNLLTRVFEFIKFNDFYILSLLIILLLLYYIFRY